MKKEEEKQDDLNITQENVNIKIVKDGVRDIGDIINILEEEVLKPEDEFDKSKLAFYVGRLETVFLNTGTLAGWFKA